MKPSAEGFFLNARNQKIHIQGWWAQFEPKATIFVVHGLGEHSGRYANFAENMTSRGFHVIAFDFPGFGKSDGKRGHVDRFEDFLDDLERAILYFKEPEIENLPLFLLGHNMGGLIAFHAGIKYPKYFKGLILSSPAFAITLDVPKIKLTVGKISAKLMPSFTVSNGIDPKVLSHDPKVVEEYENDPLVHDRISARLFEELSRAMEEVENLAPKLKLPVLIQVGGEDPIVDRKVIREVFEKIPHSDKEFLVYDNFYHEPYNERDRALALDDLERWLLKHVRA